MFEGSLSVSIKRRWKNNPTNKRRGKRSDKINQRRSRQDFKKPCNWQGYTLPCVFLDTIAFLAPTLLSLSAKKNHPSIIGHYQCYLGTCFEGYFSTYKSNHWIALKSLLGYTVTQCTACFFQGRGVLEFYSHAHSHVNVSKTYLCWKLINCPLNVVAKLLRGNARILHTRYLAGLSSIKGCGSNRKAMEMWR